MTLREKLMHYTHDLDCGVDLKQEAIATIEHIAQYMDEDKLLYHSRPLALAYLALTEDASVPVTRCKGCKHYLIADEFEGGKRYMCEVNHFSYLNSDGDMHFCSYGEPKEGTHADDHD